MVFPFFTTYNATKHALEGFSEGMWHELKPFGIAVKAVEPGYIETPIYDAMGEARPPESDYAAGIASMNEFSKGIKKRTSPERAADETWKAIVDPSDRLRYPVAAYARALIALRSVLGSRVFMNLMHERWVGRK